jgi:hypothetical protein
VPSDDILVERGESIERPLPASTNAPVPRRHRPQGKWNLVPPTKREELVNCPVVMAKPCDPVRPCERPVAWTSSQVRQSLTCKSESKFCDGQAEAVRSAFATCFATREIRDHGRKSHSMIDPAARSRKRRPQKLIPDPLIWRPNGLPNIFGRTGQSCSRRGTFPRLIIGRHSAIR